MKFIAPFLLIGYPCSSDNSVGRKRLQAAIRHEGISYLQRLIKALVELSNFDVSPSFTNSL